MGYYEDWQRQQKEYENMVGGTGDFQEALKKKYGEKYNYNADLINQKNQLQSQMFALPGQMRQEYMGGPIRNPLAQEALISNRVANVGGQVANVTDLLNQRGQQFGDILNSSMNQWNSQAEAKRLSAESAWRAYQEEESRRAAARAAAQQASWMDMMSQGGLEQSLSPAEERAMELATEAAESGWDPNQTTVSSTGTYRSFKPMTMAERNKQLNQKTASGAYAKMANFSDWVRGLIRKPTVVKKPW